MLKINFLGDSITEGYAASKRENTYVYLPIYYRECDTNVDSVFQRADKAMYQNKAEMKESH